MLVDSTSSFRLSFGFKVFIRIRFGLGLPFGLPVFWGFFPLGAFAIERAVQGSTPADYGSIASCDRRIRDILSLPRSRFSQPSYGCYILCARFGLWVCSAPLAPVGFLSFRVLPVCRAPRHLWRWFASSQLPFPYGFLFGFDEVPCLWP